MYIYIMCQNFISTHAHKSIRAAQELRNKHYTSIITYELGRWTSCDNPNLFQPMQIYPQLTSWNVVKMFQLETIAVKIFWLETKAII